MILLFLCDKMGKEFDDKEDPTLNNNYVIVTDTSADLPAEYLNQHQLSRVCLSFFVNEECFNADTKPMDEHEFYDKMRDDCDVKTMQANPEQMRACFVPYLEKGLDVLYIAFSSGLSGTYNSGVMAAEELREEYPDRRIEVVDTLAASLGQGLLTHYAVMMKESGSSLDEVKTWVEENRLNLVHLFTVDSLKYLHKGGRVSATTAIVGGMLNIKPVLHVDDNGKLVALDKVRGRKKSLLKMVDLMEEKMGRFKNEEFFISHGDCLEDAQFLADEISHRFGIKKNLIHFVCPTIGAHSGPGTVALFFFGEER